VLLTHGPPFGILDVVMRSETLAEHTGCPDLLARIQQVQPRYHLFGHIHEEYGSYDQEGVTFLNVATMNKHYEIANQPVVIEWP